MSSAPQHSSKELIQKYTGSCAGQDTSAQPRRPSHWRQEAKQHSHHHLAFCKDPSALNQRVLHCNAAPSLELLLGSSGSCSLHTSSQAALALAAERAAIDGQAAPELPTRADPAWLGRATAARRGTEREREGNYPFSAKAFYVGEPLDAKGARLQSCNGKHFCLAAEIRILPGLKAACHTFTMCTQETPSDVQALISNSGHTAALWPFMDPFVVLMGFSRLS